MTVAILSTLNWNDFVRRITSFIDKAGIGGVGENILKRDAGLKIIGAQRLYDAKKRIRKIKDNGLYQYFKRDWMLYSSIYLLQIF